MTKDERDACRLIATIAAANSGQEALAAVLQYRRSIEPEQPAWVEELAAEWEHQARGWMAEHVHEDDDECEEACNAEAKQVLRCAAELRARARSR